MLNQPFSIYGLRQRKARPMNILKPEKKLAVLSALVEGNSIRSTERMTGVHRDTILRLLVQVGENCLRLSDVTMQDLPCSRVQVDEIWTFVAKKQKRIKQGESDQEIGDQYVFVALDADSKLIPSFTVGKRDGQTALALMTDLSRRVARRLQLTTDGFSAYIEGVEEAFGTDVDYAMLIKEFGPEDPGRARYSPPVVVGVTQVILNGHPNEDDISTSYVERQNLTIRMMCRRFTRLTNAFSKKLANLKAALALHFAYYNFCRIHRTLRVTPAMAAGVTDRVWGIQDLVK
jgi:IS1 family transposase